MNSYNKGGGGFLLLDKEFSGYGKVLLFMRYYIKESIKLFKEGLYATVPLTEKMVYRIYVKVHQ